MSMSNPMPTELAPSDVRPEVPTISRIAGGFGLFAVTAGIVSVIAAQYGRGLFGEGLGYLLAAFGVTGLLLHAARDADIEVRRLYGVLAAALLAIAIVASVFPHKPGGTAEAQVGSLFLPWGAGAALLALVFFVPFARHETEEPYRRATHWLLMITGAALTIGSVAVGIAKPDFLIGPGIVLALLGLGYVCAYLAQVDTSEGRGYQVAAGLGLVGLTALVVALGRSIAPTVLHEGPASLKTVTMEWDKWKLAARVITILLGLALVAYGVRGRVPLWLRGILVVLGLAWAGVFLTGTFAAPMHTAPGSFFVPHGLILAGIGVIFIAVSLGICADNPFVVMTQRELSAYFYSPIAYIVLFVMTLATGLGYWLFLGILLRGGRGAPEAQLEPILQEYLPATFIGPLLVPFLVPALTMRLLSEEKRSGTLEVLLTAPISEWAVTLSKFLACWLFYMLCWVPAGLFLIGLRVEGGQPFDYRPLLSFYLALGVSGAAFVAVGLFFSSLTRNQIVAAVMTFVVMLMLMVVRWNEFLPGLGSAVKAGLSRLSYWMLWNQSLRGQLPLRDVLIQASIAVVFVYLTAKVLEARKWS